MLHALLAVAVASPPLRPTSKWHVDFADSQCIASRDYGTPGEPLFLVLKAPPVGDVVQIAVIRNGSLREPDQIAGEILFDEHSAIRTNFLEYGVKKLGQRALMMNLMTTDLSPMRKASTIRIRTRPEDPKHGLPKPRSQTDLTFISSDVPQVMDLLKECAADLREVWNVWDENHDSVTLKKGPSGDIQRLFSGADYPAAAQMRDQSGTTTLEILIDETGKVADCTVTETSGAASIDAQSCAILRERGKFRPAIGLDGKPAKSAWSQSITWRLEP